MVIKYICLITNYYLFEVNDEHVSTFCILLLLGTCIGFALYILIEDLLSNDHQNNGEENKIEEFIIQSDNTTFLDTVEKNVIDKQEFLVEYIKQIENVSEQHMHIINSLYDLINYFYF